MTAQLLAAELTTLIQDTKRKNTDIRNVRDSPFLTRSLTLV